MLRLAQQCYVHGDARGRALQGLRAMLEDQIGGLDVTSAIAVGADEYVDVELTGPDATVAEAVVGEAFPTVASDPETATASGAVLLRWDAAGWTVGLGPGVERTLPADELGLGPGGGLQLRERFGVVQHMPVELSLEGTPTLADATRDLLYGWRRDAAGGRVTVNSVTRGQLRATINRAGLADAIVTIERIGLLEQSVRCAEGTDPPGVVAAIGPYLPAEMKCVIPR
ncbi:MAG: DUF2110 family protein [Haloquadratum sp.]|jgi:hypothetical protein|nr:DUF2110 family protein [Haloferacaceae archaeon]MDR9445126.1 DUF2110 family protein [Haloquadratum sp.]